MRVKQIENLFELMDYFVRVRKPVSVRDIVEAFSWPRSSAFNVVTTLVELGYLYQPGRRGDYYPTSRWLSLARDLMESTPMPPSVHQLLVDLMSKTGETVFLAAPEGTKVIFLDVAESSADIRLIASIGQRLPIHVTAAGQAILAQYSAPERDKVLKRIKYEPFEKPLYMTQESVEQEILKQLDTGWFVNRGVYAPGVAGIAVPFPFQNRRNAIALGAPVSRVENRMEELGQLLKDSVENFLRENDQGLQYSNSTN